MIPVIAGIACWRDYTSVMKRRKELGFYDKLDEGTKGSFEMNKYIQPSTAAHNVA